jgi:hypothetical protein
VFHGAAVRQVLAIGYSLFKFQSWKELERMPFKINLGSN